MCATCGCDGHVVLDTAAHVHNLNHDVVRNHPHHNPHEHHHSDGGRHHHHPHHHDDVHVHSHAEAHQHDRPSVVDIERRVLEKNDRIAAANRRWLADRRILALNMVSAPGAGKTTLLARTISDLKSDLAISVIEGDQATSVDAERIREAGAPAVQINTGAGCHLDAEMVRRGIAELAPPPQSLLLIENVGNLVCPALFDLGERAKVVVASVTEGDDKPLKYPHMFRAARVVILNKLDLLPHVAFDVERFARNARQVSSGVELIQLSATTGLGMEMWHAWLRSAHAAT